MPDAVLPAAAVDDARRQRFEALAAEVYEPVQRFIRRRTEPSDADDVVAEVMLVLWRRLDDVPPDADLPWCYGVARRCLANHRRGRVRELRLVERLQQEPVAGPTDDDSGIGDALASLRAEDRELLTLWAWEGLEPRDIARVLDISANATAIRLHRAKKRLANALGKSDRVERKDPLSAGQEQDRNVGGTR